MQHTLQNSTKVNILFFTLTLMMFFILPQEVFAGSTGNPLPYESWLEDLRDSITGPYAIGISVIGTVGAFIGLIFGGDDMKGWVRILLVIVLACSMALGANEFITNYSGNGAEITNENI